MNNKLFLKASIEGVLQGIVVYLLNEFLISVYAQGSPYNQDLLIIIFSVVLSSLIYF